MTIVRQFDKEAVKEEEYRRLCDAYAPFAPSVSAHRIAVHESGHAVALLHLGITPSFMIVGDVSGSGVAADTAALRDDRSLEGITNYLAYKLAGQAAEEMEFGTARGLEDDVLELHWIAVMHQLTEEERRAVMQADSPIVLPDLPHIQAVLQLYLMALARSHEILAPHREAIQALATSAEKARCLDSKQLDALWRSHRDAQKESTMTDRADPNDEAEDVVNDTTPTNEPGPTPADSELSPTPDDRGKTTQTGSEEDVPPDVKDALEEKRNT
jgi:hypothetical protein